jgi:hypothetical protein
MIRGKLQLALELTGLTPLWRRGEGVDGRVKPGHDVARAVG